MPICPICDQILEPVRQQEGVCHPCPKCMGRALTISQTRHVMGDRIATKILRLLKLSRQESAHGCPVCRKPMSILQLADPAMELDACRACHVVWYDAPTYDLVPKFTAETLNTMAAQANEIIALSRLKELNKKEAAKEAAEKRKRRGAGSSEPTND